MQLSSQPLPVGNSNLISLMYINYKIIDTAERSFAITIASPACEILSLLTKTLVYLPLPVN